MQTRIHTYRLIQIHNNRIMKTHYEFRLAVLWRWGGGGGDGAYGVGARDVSALDVGAPNAGAPSVGTPGIGAHAVGAHNFGAHGKTLKLCYEIFAKFVCCFLSYVQFVIPWCITSYRGRTRAITVGSSSSHW